MSKHLLISWLQSPSTVILEPPKIKFDTISTVSPSISHEVMGRDAMILVFQMLSFKPTFSLSTFTSIKRLLVKTISSINTGCTVEGRYSQKVTRKLTPVEKEKQFLSSLEFSHGWMPSALCTIYGFIVNSLIPFLLSCPSPSLFLLMT